MADQNTYLRYKRYQKLLVYWITHTSNRIIKSFPSDAPTAANTTGEVSLSTLISLSGLIAKHINPIPTTIYRLFQSIIAAREQTYAVFQQIVANLLNKFIAPTGDVRSGTPGSSEAPNERRNRTPP